jgi:hypothetical protein
MKSTILKTSGADVRDEWERNAWRMGAWGGIQDGESQGEFEERLEGADRNSGEWHDGC